MRQAISHLRDAKIRFTLDHILNLPGETEEHIAESMDFYMETKAKVFIYFLNYYPRSPITRFAHEQGVCHRPVAVDELFPPELKSVFKV